VTRVKIRVWLEEFAAPYFVFRDVGVDGVGAFDFNLTKRKGLL
jgi:hypothetical protein